MSGAVGQPLTLPREVTRYDVDVRDGSQIQSLPGPYDPRARSAAWDGSTNDTTAIHNTLSDASAGTYPAVVQLPRGSANIQSGLVFRTKAHLKGDGMYGTNLVTAASLANAMQSSASFPMSSLVLEDFTIDCTNVTTNALILNGTFGALIGRTHIRRLRFVNLSAIGISIAGMADVDIEEVYFENYGLGDGTAIAIGSGGGDIRIAKADWRWVANGISVDTGSAATEYESLLDRLALDSCKGDLGWWLLPTFSSQSGSGGTVTYSSTVLTDSGKNFSSAGVTTSHYIRIMPVRATATVATQRPTALQVTGGSFLSAGIIRGDIIRTDDGTKWAVVSGVESNNIIRHEGWLDRTTMLRTTAPAATTACTVYGVVIGIPTVVGTTTLTVARWHDLDGTLWDGSAHAIPSSGTLYEVMRDHPNYQVQVEGSARNVSAVDMQLRRGWADQLSIYCPRTTIRGGLIEDGWDMGITLNGGQPWGNTEGHSLIDGVRINHQGTGGIYTTANDTVIAHPIITATTWTNHVNTNTLAGIVVEDNFSGAGSDRLIIDCPVIDGEDKPHARYGIAIRGDTPTPSEVWINNPKIRRHTTPSGNKADIHLYGANMTKVHVRNVDLTETTMLHSSSAPGGDYELVGNGDPGGVVTAGVGSQFRRKDGGAGTTLYQKESGTGNTGWVAK